MADTIAIIDYGAGNLRSIFKAVEKACVEAETSLRPIVTSDPQALAGAKGVILPGVGAAGATMTRLAEHGLVEPLREAVGAKPFLGVCLGMQLLYGFLEEGNIAGLSILPGTVRRLHGPLKVPHMGWNRLYSNGHRMFDGIAPDAYFYFAHSYFAEPKEPSSVVGMTSYGSYYAAAIAQGNLWATQFHPEKSGAAGLQLLANYAAEVEVS